MTQRHGLYLLLWVLLILFTASTCESRADATPAGVQHAVDTLTQNPGHYEWGAASLQAADCSGLVSVAQSLAMGQPPRRLGDTGTLLAGHWPYAVRGAPADSLFVIGVNPGHMVARVGGVNIESRQAGEAWRIGPTATSPFAPQFVQYHIDRRVLA